MLAARHAYQDKSVTFIFALFAIVSPLGGRKLVRLERLWIIYLSFFIYYLSDWAMNIHRFLFLFNPLLPMVFLLVFARWQTVPRPGKCPTNFLLFSLVAMKKIGYYYLSCTSVETKNISVFSFELSSECCYQLFIWLLDHWDIPGKHFVSETEENDVLVIR
jgi:hypothetical protein